MLSLFTYGLTYGVAEAQSDTKELGLKLSSSQSFGQPSDAVDQDSAQSSESPSRFFRQLFRRGGGGG
jgi:hypothetical protein